MPEHGKTEGMKLAKFLALTMDNAGVYEHELARHLGCSTAFVRMILEGKVKMPIELIPDTADIIGVQRNDLLGRAMDEYLPDVVRAVVRCASGLTDNEMAIVSFIRNVTDRSDPSLADAGIADGLRAAFARAEGSGLAQ